MLMEFSANKHRGQFLSMKELNAQNIQCFVHF